jgi:hypothetical protein
MLPDEKINELLRGAINSLQLRCFLFSGPLTLILAP